MRDDEEDKKMSMPAEGSNSIISFRRYEFKYLISPSLMEPIRNFIRPYCDMDPYAQEESDEFYTVKTFYLDSADYRSYRDVLEEVPSRFTLRIRAYGKNPGGLVKLEIKRRFNDVCYKASVKVHEKLWPKLFLLQWPQGVDDFAQTTNPMVRRFIGLARSIDAEPKMLIQYQRQAFQSRIDRYVRISFDRRLCHQTKNAFDLRAYPEDWVHSDDLNFIGDSGPRIILELKMMAHPPIWVLDMIRKFELVPRNYSKYCTAVTRLMNRGSIAHETSRATLPAQ
jgi:SPX domain protein involved in polyphosphate accumulation